MTAELPMAKHDTCDKCRLPAPSGVYGTVFEEGGRVVAMDTGYVYEVLDVYKTGHRLQNTSQPILAANLRSVPGYPDDSRTVHLHADGTPLRSWGDERTTWEHAKP